MLNSSINTIPQTKEELFKKVQNNIIPNFKNIYLELEKQILNKLGIKDKKTGILH